MKKALGVVSFGTSCKEAEASCIRPIEQAMAEAFPDWEICRAYTSGIIVRRLRSEGEQIENESELIERLRREAFDDIALASTHIVPGIEYEKLRLAAKGIRLSDPLLANGEDAAWMASLLEQIAEEEHCPLLLMGHGADNAADEIYAEVQKSLSSNVYIGCFKGSCTLDSILPKIEKTGRKEVVLMPLMLVAGRHARKDLAGDENSWKSVLTECGFDVRVRMQGLGSIRAVQQRIVNKVRCIM